MLVKFFSHAARAKVLLSKARGDNRKAVSHRSAFYREVWTEAAELAGATIEEVANEIFEIRRDGSSVKVYRNYTPLDNPVTLRFAANKPAVHQALESAKLPTPPFRSFTLEHRAKAESFLDEYDLGVVKPAAGTGAGQGITTGVSTKSDLFKAAFLASGYHNKLLIERQIPGHNYRLLFLDGELLDAVQRRPPNVVGDGHSTIAALIKTQNRERLKAGFDLAQVMLGIDLDLKRTLGQQDLTLRSVPAEGHRIDVKTVINDNTSRDNETVTDSICSEVIASARQAALATGIRLAGIDVVTPDPTQSLETVGGVILEVNTTPGYYYHYCKAGPKNRVAIPILERCLAEAQEQ